MSPVSQICRSVRHRHLSQANKKKRNAIYGKDSNVRTQYVHIAAQAECVAARQLSAAAMVLAVKWAL
jgi:hypothetical protein